MCPATQNPALVPSLLPPAAASCRLAFFLNLGASAPVSLSQSHCFATKIKLCCSMAFKASPLFSIPISLLCPLAFSGRGSEKQQAFLLLFLSPSDARLYTRKAFFQAVLLGKWAFSVLPSCALLTPLSSLPFPNPPGLCLGGNVFYSLFLILCMLPGTEEERLLVNDS